MENFNDVLEATEGQLLRLGAIHNRALLADRIIDLKGLSIEEWLILRSIAGIGASEIATALGKNPPYFKGTPLSVWKEKVSHVIQRFDNPTMRIGRNVEEAIVLEYEYLTGRKVLRVKDKMFLHTEHDFLFTDLDGLITPAGGEGWGILECKSTVSYVYETWQTKLPTYYFRQAMGELSVMMNHPFFNESGHKCEYVDFAVLILDQRKVEILRINKDGSFIEQQNADLKQFYQLVIDNIPPEPSVSELAVVEPMEGSYIEATEETYKNLSEIIGLNKQIKVLEEKKDELTEEVKKEFGENESMLYMGEVIATWKAQNKTTIDSKKLKSEMPDIAEKYSKTSTSRIFRPKELKVLEY